MRVAPPPRHAPFDGWSPRVRARECESDRGGLRREAGSAHRTVRLDVRVGHPIAGSGNPGTDTGTTECASINTAGNTTGDDAAPHATNAAHTAGGPCEVVG